MLGENMAQFRTIATLFVALRKPACLAPWGQPKQAIELLRMMPEFSRITPPKLAPEPDIEPLSQFGARCEIAESVIDSGLSFFTPCGQIRSIRTRPASGIRLLLRPLESDIEFRCRDGRCYLRNGLGGKFCLLRQQPSKRTSRILKWLPRFEAACDWR